MDLTRVRRVLQLLFVVATLALGGCGDSDDGGRVVDNDLDDQSSCVVCHTDASALQPLAIEEELPEDTGEG